VQKKLEELKQRQKELQQAAEKEKPLSNSIPKAAPFVPDAQTIVKKEAKEDAIRVEPQLTPSSVDSRPQEAEKETEIIAAKTSEHVLKPTANSKFKNIR
jgi:hypothetical protein